MAITLTVNDTVSDIVVLVQELNEEEQLGLLASLRAKRMLRKGIKKVIDKPLNVSMETIDKWKHDSRKYAK